MSTFGVSQSTWYDSVIRNADYSIILDATAPEGYLVKGRVYRFLGNLNSSKAQLEKAYAIAPTNPDVLEAYGYQLLREMREEGADMVLKATKNQYSPKDPEYYNALTTAYFFSGDLIAAEGMLTQTKNLNPGAIEPYQNLSFIYNLMGDYDKAIDALKTAEKINPDMAYTLDQLAWMYFKKKDYENAARYWAMYPKIEANFKDTTQTVPFRHRLAMVYSKIGKKKEGDKLVQEDLKIREKQLKKNQGMGAWGNFGTVYYDLAVDHIYLENDALAVQYLDSAFQFQFYYFEGYDNDPIFDKLKTRNDFKQIVKKKTDWYEFNKKAFSNALNRAKASKEFKGLLEK